MRGFFAHSTRCASLRAQNDRFDLPWGDPTHRDEAAMNGARIGGGLGKVNTEILELRSRMTKDYTGYDWKMGLLPEIPGVLVETAAVALEWPRLREHIAGMAASPLGRGWILALEPSADLPWIVAQQQRTAEIRGFV